MLTPGDAALEARDLSRSFGRVRVIEGLSLSVRRGEIYGFLGRNGAGKTTTIRMIMGLLAPGGGEITVLGHAARRTPNEVKARIGYVSQHPHFYPWMTAERLGRFVAGFYPTWDHEEFRRLLGAMNIPADRRVSLLSGGTQTKLSLALALSHTPEILILDEPTAGLDPVARREFLAMIRAHSRRHHRTTFFSTHLIDEVELIADRIGVLHQGRLLYEGEIGGLVDTVRRIRWQPPARPMDPEGQEAAPDEAAAPTRPPAARATPLPREQGRVEDSAPYLPPPAGGGGREADGGGRAEDSLRRSDSPEPGPADPEGGEAAPAPVGALEDDGAPQGAGLPGDLLQWVAGRPDLSLLDRRGMDLGLILRGPAGWWRDEGLPPALATAPLDLEDVFVAVASDDVPLL